jgi:hypothetical protein
VCHGDSLISGAPALAYGQSASSGPYRCDSATTHVTCRHTGTGDGFHLAREFYEFLAAG